MQQLSVIHCDSAYNSFVYLLVTIWTQPWPSGTVTLQVHPSMVALFNVMHFHPAWWTCNVKKFYRHCGILTFWWLAKCHYVAGIIDVTKCHRMDGIVNVKKFHHSWVHLEVTLEMQSWKVDTPQLKAKQYRAVPWDMSKIMEIAALSWHRHVSNFYSHQDTKILHQSVILTILMS